MFDAKNQQSENPHLENVGESLTPRHVLHHEERTCNVYITRENNDFYRTKSSQDKKKGGMGCLSKKKKSSQEKILTFETSNNNTFETL